MPLNSASLKATCGHSVVDKGLDVLYAVNPRTKVYVFRNNGSNLGHEKEVLFGARANLKIVRKTLINDSYSVGKFQYPDKTIPAYVIEVTIS